MAKTKLNPAKLRSDPVYFIEKILGFSLTSFQKEWLYLIEEKHRVCLMAFRTSGKTRQLFVNYFIWKAITNPSTQYLIISKTLPQAIEVLKDIRISVITNPFLKVAIPSNKSKSWSRTELEFANSSRILSKAYNDNIRGLHVSGLGCDELGEYENHEIFKKAVLPTIRAKRGFLICTGTPKSELDLLHEIERDPGFASIYSARYPAEGEKGDLFLERYPDTTIVHEDNAVVIKDKKTGKVLETYSNMAWSQEFLLRPISLKDKLFPDGMVEACLAPGEIFQETPKHMHQYFAGIDFAMSAQAGSDYTVITILEKSPLDRRLRVVYIERFRGMDYNMQKQKIIELANRYQITKALGDENSFGKVFIYDLIKEGIPIEGYKFTYQSHSKEELIKALRDQFEKQGFIIPYGDETKTKSTVKSLVDELTKFGIIFDYKKSQVKFEGSGTHDDLVISLALANFIARNITMGMFTIRTSERKESNPFVISKI